MLWPSAQVTEQAQKGVEDQDAAELPAPRTTRLPDAAREGALKGVEDMAAICRECCPECWASGVGRASMVVVGAVRKEGEGCCA